MKLIQELSEMVDDEIRDVHRYAAKAIEVKEKYPELAETFIALSKSEGDHMNKLHTQVARLIQDYRNKHGEPPGEMMAVYDYLHKKQIESYAEAKRLQDIYSGR